MAFRSPPAKVHSYVTKLLKANLIKTPPVWYTATTLAPPSPTFIREPEAAAEAEATSAGANSTSSSIHNVTRSSRSNKHLRSKTERPQKIVYPEDRLRRRFYEDHPWELRRPRCLVETNGDGTHRDWSTLLQKDRSVADLTGEDVIQYQLYLMSKGAKEQEAYHLATKEFYLIRAQEETEARVAKAQAMAFGLQPRRSFVMSGLKREEEALLEAEKNAAMF
ncbi:mitochondrial ribosomal protein S25 [Mortierella sp. GBAus27b]|nr:mitochondrial ribosomal protein S25 [Mortierella sp. GBAus27b]